MNKKNTYSVTIIGKHSTHELYSEGESDKDFYTYSQQFINHIGEKQETQEKVNKGVIMIFCVNSQTPPEWEIKALAYISGKCHKAGLDGMDSELVFHKYCKKTHKVIAEMYITTEDAIDKRAERLYKYMNIVGGFKYLLKKLGIFNPLSYFKKGEKTS